MTDLSLLETETTIGDNKYRIQRLSLFQQMQVATDFRNIITGLAMMKKSRPTDPEKMSDEDFMGAARLIIMSSMPPEARARSTNLCFRKIARQSGQGWAPILSSDSVMQFEDIDPVVATQLLYASFEHNRLLDFFSASPFSLDGLTTDDSGLA